MFKKKPNIKPLAPLRSSDRRKIADQIISDFNVDISSNDEAKDGEGDQIIPGMSLGALRNSLLPENALSARFTTTAGPDLKQVSGTVYAGAHPGEEQRILWFKVEEKLIPTVYTLWKHAQLVPLLHTADFVLQKLRGGAPLMTPGLQRGPPFPAKATKDAIVAVASLENPSVPVVVGICEIDVACLERVQGTKGHAVRGEHWAGDELWSWSPTGRPGGSAPEQIDGWDTNGTDINLSNGFEQLSVEEHDDDAEDGGVLLGGVSADEQAKVQPRNHFVEGEDAKPYEEIGEDNRELSTKEIDDVFWNAFLYGVQHHRKTHKSNPREGLNFPIQQSLIISNFVLPYFPIFPPTQAASLQIKKTSWKNAKKFLKALDKKKLLKSKDRDGGECVVLDIDFNDPAITNFVPYKLPKKDTPGADSGGGGGGGNPLTRSSTSTDDSINQSLTILNLFRPKDALSPLFSASNASLKSLYLPAELRQIITAYIESENLLSPTNKRLVVLNPILSNALFNTASPLDREVLAKGTILRDALTDRILQLCTPYHAILRDPDTRETAKPHAGSAPKVQIVLETRSGNKTVTKLSGVEAYHINPQLLAEELQKACASSTSVGLLAGSSPKQPVMEILVQGPQREFVLKALERRGVGRGWVEVVDKTKGRKR